MVRGGYSEPVTTGISPLKSFLHGKFHTMYLWVYFLSVEGTRIKKGIFLSQRKCVLDLLAEMGKLGFKSYRPSLQ